MSNAALNILTGGAGAAFGQAKAAEPAGEAPAAAPPDEGTHALRDPETGLVAVTNPDGSTDFVRHEDAAAALAEGARPATEGEYYAAKGGALGTAAAGAIGAARTLSFGTYDPLFVAAGKAIGGEEGAEHARRALRIAKEAHPNATTTGEIVGALVPLALGSPSQAAEEAGALGDGFFARAGARAAQAAPRAIAEGTAIGLGNQLSEDTLQNHELVAENYIASGIKGGLIGAIMGAGAASGIGAISDRFAQRFAPAAEKAVEGEAGRAESIATRTGSDTPRAEQSWLEKTANEQRFKGMHPRQGEIEKIGATAEEQAERANRIGSRIGEIAKAEGIGPLATPERWSKAVGAKLNEAGKELGQIRNQLDSAAARPSIGAIAKEYGEKYLSRLEGMPIAQEGAERSQKYLEKMSNELGDTPSFKDLFARKRDLDGWLEPHVYAKKRGIPLSPEAEGMLALRTAVEKEAETAADRAATELGQDVGNRYRLAKQLYGDLATAKGILRRAAASGNANRAISLSDTIHSAAAIPMALLSVLSGHPAGLLALAAPVANNVVRKYGNQIAAHVLDKVGELGVAQRASTRVADSLRSGTRAFMEGSASKKAAASAADLKPADIRAISRVVNNPAAVQANVAAAIAPLKPHAPKLAAVVATKLMNAAAYWRDTLPKATPAAGLHFGPAPDRPMSAVDLRSATARIQAADDPTKVVDALVAGKLTADHVEAMKIVHPETYRATQQYIREHGAELRPQLTVQQQMALTLFFGEPVNAASMPDNLRGFQEAFARAPKEPQGGPPGAPSGGSGMVAALAHAGGTRATQWDQMEAGQ